MLCVEVFTEDEEKFIEEMCARTGGHAIEFRDRVVCNAGPSLFDRPLWERNVYDLSPERRSSTAFVRMQNGQDVLAGRLAR
jgi:hypothetical protein